MRLRGWGASGLRGFGAWRRTGACRAGTCQTEGLPGWDLPGWDLPDWAVRTGAEEVGHVDKAGVDRWLQAYVDAWKSYDRDQIGDLFAEDVQYRYHPHDDPVTGREAV